MLKWAKWHMANRMVSIGHVVNDITWPVGQVALRAAGEGFGVRLIFLVGLCHFLPFYSILHLLPLAIDMRSVISLLKWLAVSTRPVVSALRVSILSALAGLCKEFYWHSPGGVKWPWPCLKHSLGQHESLCQVWSWSEQPFGRPSAIDRQTNR